MESIIQIITAFLGSLGFAIVFNIKKSNLFISAVGGCVSWGTYLVINYFLNNEPLSYFISAIITTFYSEILARVKKSPATIGLICSIVPLIPGSSLYYTMRYAFSGQWELFSEYGLNTIALAAALAFGIIVVSTIIKLILKFGKLSSNN